MIPQLRTFRLFLIKLICLLSINSNVNAEFRLTILHTNDMHARFEQTNELSGKCSVGDVQHKICYGGFARLKEAVNMCKIDAKSRDRNVLFLNAGDTYQGTPYYKLFKWKIVARMFELLDIDAASLGNHEFDDGPDGLAPFIDNVTVPMLCSNLDLSKVPVLQKSKLKNSTVFEFSGGIKIGVVGYLTPDTKIISNSGDTEFLPEIPCIQEEVNKLRNEGVFLIIALGHSGFQKDLEIAKKVKGVDVVVGGHTNTFLYNGEQPSTEDIKGSYPTIVTQDNGKKVPVVQAYAYTKYLGVIDLDFDDRGVLVKYKGNAMILNSTIPEDPEVLEALKPYKTAVDSQTSEEIGVTKVLLYGNDKTRLGESNLANFITDAYVDYIVRQYNGTGWTDSPIAIVQSGGIRSSIDAFTSDGVVTNTDVQTVLPFEDPLCRIELKGKYLLEALEWSVSEYGIDGSNLAGAFLHVSGLKIVYDVSKPKGKRVAKALAKCGNCTIPIYSEVEPDKLYAILFSRYLSEGGDGFSMFKKNRISFTKFPITDTSIVTDYFSKESPIYPGLEGRITIENFKLMSKNNAETLLSSTLLTCLVIVYLIA